MNLFRYLKDTKTEMTHVSWPTQKTTTVFTVLVIVISVGVAAYIGAFDYLFSYLVGLIIN